MVVGVKCKPIKNTLDKLSLETTKDWEKIGSLRRIIKYLTFCFMKNQAESMTKFADIN
jgi:hypothetical protein